MSAPRPNHWKLLLGLALLCGIVIAIGLQLRASVIDDRTYRLCERIRMVTSGGGGELEPGDPGYAYYLEHPDENASRVKAAQAVEAAFRDCEQFR